VADAGFTVYVPVLAGPATSRTAVHNARAVATVCVSREFVRFATGRTSPIVRWLRALARHIAPDGELSGVGVVGMCFSGGFALAMAADTHVAAAVAAQPSLPLPFGIRRRSDLGMDAGDLEVVRQRLRSKAVEILALRFSADRLSPCERFGTLVHRLGPEGVTVDVLDSAPGNDYGFGTKEHSVLTIAPTHEQTEVGKQRLERAAQSVLDFLKRRLS
jgi:dienelactone hydrolase